MSADTLLALELVEQCRLAVQIARALERLKRRVEALERAAGRPAS